MKIISLFFGMSILFVSACATTSGQTTPGQNASAIIDADPNMISNCEWGLKSNGTKSYSKGKSVSLDSMNKEQ